MWSWQRDFAAFVVVSCAWALGCSSPEPAATGGGGSGASGGNGGGGATIASGGSGGTGGANACGTANGTLPDGLTEIAWDDGTVGGTLREQTWTIDVNGHTYDLNQEPLWEAVRFDLERPGTLYGFAVEWAGIADGAPPEQELVAGLYLDFGHNGFDFWAPDPIFLGSRCVGDMTSGEMLTYVLPEPIVVPHPGLVYVAHLIQTPADPVFPFDSGSPDDADCTLWDDCHSAMNLPEAETSTFYNGVSFPFQRDYRVRLYVAYEPELTEEELVMKAASPSAVGPTAHVSFGDYDNDGWDDIVTDGPKLWHNEGDGTFTDATDATGIAALGVAATGGVFGDYDNDGCLDLFLYAESYTAKDTLLRAACDGTGTFLDATASAGIIDLPASTPCVAPENNLSPAAAASWIDIDADGYLDLYIANFICWDSGAFYTDAVYHNLKDGTFEDWTGKQGFLTKKTPSRGAAPADYDGDGDVDLFVNNYRLVANLMYANNGDGTVIETAKTKGTAGKNVTGYYGHTIGAAWGDLDNDGDFDLISANLAHPRFFDFSNKTEVLIQQPNGTFKDISDTWAEPGPPHSGAGLRYQETHSVPALADFDQNGTLDLVISAVYDGRPMDFYWGNGDGTFTLDAYHAGLTTENGWGVGISDVDNDGDPDVFATTLFLNALPAAKKGHFVQVRAVGGAGLGGSANRSAIGATVMVHAGGKTFTRQVQGGTGKGGQDSMYLCFGLGEATSVADIVVRFPGGLEQTYAGPFDADTRIWVFEDGATHIGYSPP